MRRGLSSVAFTFLLGLGSCRVLFAIDDLARGDGTAEADSSTDAANDNVAPLRCVQDAAWPVNCACEDGIHHAFCDDFDTLSETLGARWSGLPGMPNPMIKGNAAIVHTDAALTPPRAVVTTASEQKTSSYAVIVHQLASDAKVPIGGARFRQHVQIAALSFTEARGPIVDAGAAMISSMAHFEATTLKFAGVAVLATSNGVFLFASQDLLEPRPSADAAAANVVLTLNAGQIQDLSNFVRIEILVAYKSVAVREGFVSCRAVAGDDTVVFAGGFGPSNFSQVCGALPASFGGLSWLSSPIITAGAALYGGGSLSIRDDSLSVDFLEP